MAAKKKKKKNFVYVFSTYLFVGMNIMNILVMVCCAYSPFINPANHPSVACLGLVFPVVALVNFAFILFWLIFRVRFVWIPFVGYLLCAAPLYTYSPVNFSKEMPDGTLKVMSYNTGGFMNDTVPPDSSLMVRYLKQVNADVVCMQEAHPKFNIDYFLNFVDSLYPYKNVIHFGRDSATQMVLSKYPLLSVERIPYQSYGNGSAAYRLLVDGDTVTLVNNHFESNRLTVDDKDRYRDMFRDVKKDTIVVNSKNVFGKVRVATSKRAGQVDTVACYIREHVSGPLIVCGDFNDSPLSYTHYTFSRFLTDSYVESGNGLGFSFKHSGIWVRIDHIFHSEHWESYDTYIDKKVELSDHYPIITHLKRVKKNK